MLDNMLKFKKNRWKNFYYFKNVDSTNNVAEHYIGNGVRNGIVQADAQTTGQGRSGRSWFSPEGKNLFVSFFSRIDSAEKIPFLSIIAALAVAKTAEQVVGEKPVSLKWPNDVLLERKKFSGVLGKTILKGGTQFYILGIGINVETPDISAFEYSWEPTSLEAFSDKKLDKYGVFEELIKQLEHYLDLEKTVLIDQYNKSVSWMIGRKGLFTQDHQSFFEGKITAFSQDGCAIVIEKEDGEKQEFATLSIEKLD